ncbi:DUF1028 domain-containing protein [Marinoscillum furvescens]|uniref:Putative Ntn-hydrolase superfamily protein n=1 Tax=Marinoscillum furvescens DSM 4134 TaxID=1122208 RepID=A0A3D9KZN7_MARFU|nr:DUF1028 domain-containing protein [Marinoscillum furvescens]RED93874.1 putative Ntn-hydrolase superfamily protein [Marinoscillum furvescens DSM 4134]
MNKIITVFCLSLLMVFGALAQYNKENPLTHTYSIVAYDKTSGDIGVAVQSHWFSVGTVVTWAEAGVGAIATQSFSNPAFGPQGLALLKTGLNAEQTLAALIASDEGEAYRQVGVIDASGLAASHTGSKNIPAAGHLVGEGYAVQANLMEKETVWPAMARAFEDSEGKPLAERLILALEAAQREGGDIRGKQSAAVLVVSGKSTGKPWIDRKVDLRVDDHAEPLLEIRRLWKVHQAYEFMNQGDHAVEAGDFEKAGKLYERAEQMFPDNLEMQYWHAINLANIGEMEKALPMFKSIFKKDSKWKTLTPRLLDNGVLTVGEEDLKKILKQ